MGITNYEQNTYQQGFSINSIDANAIQTMNYLNRA